MAKALEQINFYSNYRKIVAIYIRIFRGNDVPELYALQSYRHSIPNQYGLVDVGFAPVNNSISSGWHILYWFVAVDAPLVEPCCILWHFGPHTLWFFIPNRSNAACIPILGKRLSCKALHAHIPKPDTCRLRVAICPTLLFVSSPFPFPSFDNHQQA